MKSHLATKVGGGLCSLALLASTAASQEIEPLDQVPVPRPDNLAQFVRNEAAAVLLGKALFWDQQVGSDGRTACASCHHAAGADPRTTNTVNPGANGVFDTVLPGQRIAGRDFPITGDDVIGSQGVVDKDFVRIVHGGRLDIGVNTFGGPFGALPQVTGRNTPTAINAVFNESNFWDGRANNSFDGSSVRNDGTGVLQVVGGVVQRVLIELIDSSAASQSVGPPNSDVEMAWAGRQFADIGKKMLALRPLGTQAVHPQDSVLGALRHPSGNGLARTYSQLIADAFQSSFWDSNAIIDRNGNVIGAGVPVGLDQFSLTEANFSLFWGLAIQMYESTLISSDAPIDRFARGNAGALSARQQLGMDLFFGSAECSECHGGSEFTNASVNVGGNGRAFNNIGVEPLSEDPGNEDGEFKTPGLRNTELTGPYFHSGKYPTLRAVVDFYNRGGDVPNDAIEPLGLTVAERDALVDFLLALTDDRVRFQRAPFDHPSLNPVNRAALPAVGALGAAVPLRTFLALNPFNPGPGGQ
jgi:cytochrome c peroxidase